MNRESLAEVIGQGAEPGVARTLERSEDVERADRRKATVDWLERPPGRRLAQALFFAAAAAVLGYLVHLVASHTIDLVQARGLLPRWDVATHLGYGWVDYNLLATGRIPQLLLDLWFQGYWPPVLSLYQVPFYLVLGGKASSGLLSGLVALALTVIAGAALLRHQSGRGDLFAASLFLALLMSSPFLLAHSSVTMTETPGALAQVLVLLAYARYRERPGKTRARTFAISLTILFFTKYNYFFMLAVPLALLEWIEATSGHDAAARVRVLTGLAGRAVRTPTGALLMLYAAGVAFIVFTGGFEFQVLGRPVSVRTIGNSGYVVLYFLLARLWFLHRRGRIDWGRLMSAEIRVGPLLRWFAVPVTAWLASPYPNHLRDVANLLINRPMGGISEAGAESYVDVLRSAYFYDEWVFAFVAGAFLIAAARYKVQQPVARCLILAVPLQLAAIALHWTRSPRFLLLTVVLLCLAASGEVGRWLGRRRGRLLSAALAPVVMATAVVAGRSVVQDRRFVDAAFEYYTDSSALVAALESIRGKLEADDRLLVIGQSDSLSPALFRWELGPPSGVACFPYEMGGTGRLDPALATRVLVLEPLDPDFVPLEALDVYRARRAEFVQRVDGGEFVLEGRYPVPDMGVALLLYQAVSRPAREAPCRQGLWPASIFPPRERKLSSPG